MTRLTIISFLIICTQVYSQTNEGKVHSKFNDKNYHYIGIENPLIVQYDSDSIFLTITNGKIYTRDSKYIAVHSKPGKSTIKIFKLIDKDSILIDSAIFNVFLIPEPIITINGIDLQNIKSKKSFKGGDTLVVHFDIDIPKSNKLHWIINYSVEIENKRYTYNDNLISSEFVKLINSCTANCSVLFTDIWLMGIDGGKRKFHDIRLQLQYN